MANNNGERVLAGYVDVDAGLVFVGDPCYTMGDDASSRVTKWGDFCDALFYENGKRSDYEQKGFANPLGQGVGVAVQSGYGDGTYPVYVTYGDEGRVASVTIEFMGDEDD